jgi:putative ABC transport system ATP-binding protein
MELFQELNEKGKTIVFVTHEPDIARLTKRNIVFRDGHIIKEQPVTNWLRAIDVLKNLPVEEDND